VEFAASGSLLVTASDDRSARIWDVKSRSETQKFMHAQSVARAVLSQNGQLLITQTSPDNLVHLWDTRHADHELARIATFRDGTWIAVTPTGQFDTNNLEDIRGMAWQFPDSPTRPLAPEVFMRNYYEPRLLSRI